MEILSGKLEYVAMLVKKKVFIFMIACSVTFIFPSALIATSKTLERTLDPVVIECKDFNPLLGTPIDRLALMARNGDKWAPIPFQIDQKKPDGSYAFTSGPEANKDSNPNLDFNDELVFVAGNTGDKADKVAFPERVIAAVEIEITDPKTSKKGWVYLCGFSGKAPRSKVDYVKVEYIAAKNRTRFSTDDFVLEMPEGSISADFLAEVKPDGSIGPNILDRVKIHLEVDVSSLKLHFDFRIDKLIKSRNKAWIDGPVRVLHSSEGFLQIAKIVKFKMGGDMITALYPNSMEFPLRMDPPEVVEESGSSGQKKPVVMVNEYIYLDFNSKAYGAKYFSKISPLRGDIVFDGKMSEAELNMDRKTQIDWSALYFHSGCLVSRVSQEPPPDDEKFLPRSFYLDDKTKKDEPENETGVSAMGLALYNVGEGTEQMFAKGKSAIFRTIFYFKKDFNPKQISEILNIRDFPLKLFARPVNIAH